MSKRKSAAQVNKVRRINLKGLLILAGSILAIAIAYFPIKYYTNKQVRASALEQAKQVQEKGDIDLAIRYLDSYVENWPDDIEAQERLAKLRSDTIRSYDDIVRAASLNDHLLRVDPEGKKGSDCQATRRRLVKLWNLLGDQVRRYAVAKKDNKLEANESRYRAAVSVATQLVYGVRDPSETDDPKKPKDRKDWKVTVPGVGDTDAEAHQLLAQALEGIVRMGDKGAWKEMEAEYNLALKLNPGDAPAALRLALMQLEHTVDDAARPVKGGAPSPTLSLEESKAEALRRATATMDRLLEGGRDSVPIRLARYEFLNKLNRPADGKAELDAALKLKPDDPGIGLEAAKDAFRRKDRAEARARLDALPKTVQDDLNVRLLRGYVELAEQNPDEAIQQWRKGLTAVGGTDLTLSFELARILIMLGRLPEARPLVNHFQRLESEESRSLGRYLQGLFEQRAGRPARAIEDLLKAQDKLPEGYQAELQFTLGKCYEAIGDVAKASTAYRRATIAAPGSANYRLANAQLLLAHNPEEAIKEIDQARLAAPDEPSLLMGAARLEFARQQMLPQGERSWSRMEELLNQAAKLAPGEFAFVKIRAEYLTASGNPGKAVELFEKNAKGPSRKNSDAWITWASVLEVQGKRAEALKILEEGATPEAAGDHASIRIARATVLSRMGQGQAAREVLSAGRERVPQAEQPELSRALGILCLELGDRDAARASFLEWSRQQPDSPDPALALIDLSRTTGDAEAARVGSELLRGLGGDSEPYGMAAQALELLRPDPAKPGIPAPEKLERAERLLDSLQAAAPQMSIGHLLRGSLFEYRNQLEAAAKEYDLARKDPRMKQALVNLVGVLTKLKKYDELQKLQREYEAPAGPGRQVDAAIGFDRISAAAALKSGDKARAEAFAARIAEQLPDSIEARNNLAQMLDELGKPREAEAALQAMVDRRPFDPAAWLALVTYQTLRGKPGDAAKTIEQARTKFKGDRPELVIARCLWASGDMAAATNAFAVVAKKAPSDPLTLQGLAAFEVATGKVAEYETTLRKALKLNPTPTWAARELAVLLSSRNDPAAWDEAWALVEPGSKTSGTSPEDRLIQATLLARSPDSDRRAEAAPALVALAKDLPPSNRIGIEARARLAQALLEYDQPVEAESFIAPLADDLVRNDSNALAISAQALARSGKVGEANARLARLLAIEPKSPRVTSIKAWILAAEGKVPEAMTTIESGVAELDDSPAGEKIALAFSDQARKIGKGKLNEPLARKIVGRWPRACYLIAQIELERGKFTEALPATRAAIEAGSVREAILVASSLAVARREDPAFLKEIDSLTELARSRAPKLIDVILLQALTRHFQERYEEEINLYREARALNPPSVLFLNNMAWSLSEALKKPEEALQCIDEAIKRVGKLPQFLDTRGVILARLGRFPEAIAELELAVKYEPAATTYFHLARTYFKAGKVEDFRRCRELARQKKFDPATLDPTDRADLDLVMFKNP